MRHIDNRQLPRYASLTDIDNAKAALSTCKPRDRRKFIRANANKCSALRASLWMLGTGKCWYSEAILKEGEGHVEHFRPKGKISSARHAGYWWRAFDWPNLRLAHSTVNFRRTSFTTQQRIGKGSYFPLADPTSRAKNIRGEAGEIPLLLDPTIGSDCLLLSFDTSMGTPVPTYSAQTDAWKHLRAKESIEYYDLKDGTWVVKRKDLADDMGKLCDRIVQEFAKSPTSKAYSDLIDELLPKLGPHAEFSAVAWQVVREKGVLDCVIPVP